MRQRNIKDLDKRIEQNSAFLVREPRDLRGRWHEVFGNGNPIYLEIGSGKGRYIMTRAQAEPDRNFIACEGREAVGLRILEKTQEAGLPNVRAVLCYMDDCREFFEKGELDGIYLNFSDPWPKGRHAKRRLTYGRNLEAMMDVLKPGAAIEFKTDNDRLFEFSMEEIASEGCEILEMTRDLHGDASEFESKKYITEYESKFLSSGKNINYVKFRRTGTMIFARENGRAIPREDKIFSISNRAKAMIQEVGKENVINGTIGALMDDEGGLIVLDSVKEVFASLDAEDYAPYAPIRGIPEFREAVKKAAFGSYEPKGFTEVCATPGGTGAVRNTVANYSSPGEKVLVADWFWAPYKTVCQELGRELATFSFIDEEGGLNVEDLRRKVFEILESQDGLVVILNTPAHNPTGYSITVEEWRKVRDVFSELPEGKLVTLLVDAAYIDFAGDEEEVRDFLPVLEEMPENVLPIMGYSASKTFTMYGMRCGAMICLAKTAGIADEFRRVTEVSSRASWSNCNRAPQTIIARIFADPKLKEKVDRERAEYRDMLLRRGKTFEAGARNAGLEILPFDAGFFVSIPMPNADEVAQELEKQGIFLVPLAKGLRVSVAAVPEKDLKTLPEKIKACMDSLAKQRGDNR